MQLHMAFKLNDVVCVSGGFSIEIECWNGTAKLAQHMPTSPECRNETAGSGKLNADLSAYST